MVQRKPLATGLLLATKRESKDARLESLVTDSDIRNVATALLTALTSPISAHFVRLRDTESEVEAV
jgi:hypothetical protein